MKTKLWLVLGTMISASVLAQQLTNTAPAPSPAPPPTLPVLDAPPAAAPKTNAHAAKTALKKSARKKAPAAKKAATPAPKPAARKPASAALHSVPLVPGPASVVASNVNVRGLPALKGEVVAHVTKGQQVIVIEEVVLKNSAPDEPSAWAKIQLPEGVHVWVNTMFIDADTRAVKPKKLNLRGGPGENYSVLGRIESGQVVREVTTKAGWMEIEAPTNAYAFMAAQYLKQEPVLPTPPPAVASTTTTQPVPPPAETATPPATKAEVTEAPPVAAAPSTETPSLPPAMPATATPPPAVTTAAVPSQQPATEPAEDEPLPKRIVMREGFVRGTTSIQAPTKFELISADNGMVIDYLFTDSADLDLNRYKGLHIIVTGEEGLDARWRRTPVLTIEKIEVLE